MNLVKINTPKVAKAIKIGSKCAEIGVVESAKVATSMLTKTMYPDMKIACDALEMGLRVFISNLVKSKYRSNIVFGNPANILSDIILGSLGKVEFKNTMKKLFK